ncbi:Por secretion system C-terminal sorting domain-containing protein, partial [Salegentibacter flavus]
DPLSMSTPTSTPISCNGGNDGTATAGDVSGGNSGYLYKLDAGTYGTSNTFSGLTSGTYTITVKDSKNCETFQTVTVTQPDPLTSTSPSSTPVSCNGGNDGTITAGTPSGGNGDYQYKLNGGTYGTSNSLSGLAAGTYTIMVRDSKGCEISQSVTVAQPDALTMVTPTSTPVSCNGGNDGTVTAGTVTGGNGDYLYSIDNVTYGIGTTFSGLTAGTHTIFVKDSKGCALQKSVTVSEPAVLSATVDHTNISCFEGNDGTISLSSPGGGSGSYEYSIDAINWQTGQTFSGLKSGSYKVYIRDAAQTACVIILKDNLQLTQPEAALTADLTTTRTTTYGTSTGSATVNASGGTPGYTYEWRKAGETAILQSTKTVNNFAAGNYTLTVIDSKGCRDEKDFTIIDGLEAFIVSRSICESIEGATDMRTSYFEVENLTAFGGVAPYEYSWDFGADAANPLRKGVGEHQVFFSEIGNKIITLTITDSTGIELIVTQSLYVGKCYEPCGKSENIVFDPNNFYVGDSNGTAIDLQNNCNDQQNKYIYLKVDKSANAYNPYVELVYIVRNDINEIIDTNFIKGCRNGDDIDDDPNDSKDNKIGEYIRFTKNPIDFKCGDNLDIDNFYITWTNVSKKDCGQNNNAFCYSIDDPLVLPTALDAKATANEILCKGEASGIINVKVSGGFAPYTYSLTEDNPEYQTNSQFINNEAGDYIIYIKDARGNTTTASVSIIEPTYAISAEVVTTPPLCFGETGEATVTATGGTPFTTGVAYQYLWNDAGQQTTATATGLTAGNYTVTVIDANGCQILKEVTIIEPVQPSPAEAGINQSFSCGFNSTLLEANTPVTGTGTWSIISGTGGTIANVNDPNSGFTATAGTHILRWTIAHADGSCANYDEVQITFVGDCSTLDFDGVDDHIIFGNKYGLTSGTFSMEAWVKLKSINGVKTILSKRNMRNPGEGGYDLVINQGAPTFRWGNSSVSSSSQLGTQRWYHIAVIFKDSRAHLYVDGIRVGNAAATNPAINSSPFLIGAEFDKNNPEIPQNYFHGWIEEVRVWNTALTEEQLRFMMNQRLEVNVTPVKGEVLPMSVPGNLAWTSLEGYYQLLVNEIANGITKDKAANKVEGLLKNITTPQDNTAPLPYIAAINGSWWDTNTWKEPLVWDPPSSPGITGDTIAWNIVRLDNKLIHNPASTNNSKSIDLLALLDEGGTLDMQGANNVSGNGLTITRYFKLDGVLDLNGESQLIQSKGSEVLGSGHIERDQQGTASSFNYNYWSSPVLPSSSSTYTVAEVMFDGTIPGTDTYEVINFGDRYAHADGPLSSPIKISNFWINVFRKKEANQYSQWERIGSNPTDPQYFLKPGEGYTMKGTHWVSVKQNKLQNYTFKGFPNNGDIELTGITADQNYLIGNPYPSAVNAIKFIEGHLQNSNPSLSGNVFNGTIYYWDHYSGQTHYLEKYVGGYAAFNLSGGLKAISNDDRINDDTNETGTKTPGPYIPVGQGFFINTASGDSGAETNTNISGGTIKFKNEYRVFASEANKAQSLFLSHESPSKQKVTVQANKMQKDTRYKIRLQFNSPKGYLREILVTADRNATNGIDLGYDAPLLDNSEEDMYWMINDNEFVIQGVPNFYLDQVLPIGLKIAEESEFGIKISKLENLPEHVNIYLHDKIDDSYFDLTKADFKASLSPEIYNNRYEIVFYNGEEPEEDVDDEDLALLEMGYSYNSRELHIKNPEMLEINKLVIYSISGQEVHSFLEVPKAKLITLELDKPLSSAVYVVRAYTNKGEIATQVIIKQ